MSASRPIPNIAAEAHALLANVVKPTVPDVLPLVREYYARPGNGAGGSLHIVLDDGNVDDDSVRFCLDWAEQRFDDNGAALAEVLLRMSKTQRMKLYRMKWESR